MYGVVFGSNVNPFWVNIFFHSSIKRQAKLDFSIWSKRTAFFLSWVMTQIYPPFLLKNDRRLHSKAMNRYQNAKMIFANEAIQYSVNVNINNICTRKCNATQQKYIFVLHAHSITFSMSIKLQNKTKQIKRKEKKKYDRTKCENGVNWFIILSHRFFFLSFFFYCRFMEFSSEQWMVVVPSELIDIFMAYLLPLTLLVDP